MAQISLRFLAQKSLSGVAVGGRNLRQIPRRFLRQKSSDEAADRFLIAEDHELTGVFHDREPAPPHLGKEYIASDETIHVADFAADDAAFACGLRAEQMGEPSFG